MFRQYCVGQSGTFQHRKPDSYSNTEVGIEPIKKTGRENSRWRMTQ